MKKALIGVIISILTIAVIFRLTETNVTWQVIFQANLFFLSIAFLLHVFFWFFWAIRLKSLADSLGQPISLGYALEVSIASTFLAAITPSSAGGEPLRIKMLHDAGVSVGSATAVVLAERLLDAIFFIAALPVFLLLTGFSTKLGIEIGLLFALCLFGFIIFLYLLLKRPERLDSFTSWLVRFIARFSRERAEKAGEKIRAELMRFREALISLAKNSYRKIASIMVITSCIWFSEFLVPSAILAAFGCDPELLLSLTSQLILVIISLVPLTPGASGIAEVGMSYLYSKFVPQHIIGVLTGVWRFITYFLNLIVGFVVNVKLLKSKYIDQKY
ncbi:flippase-like domain-containing protein [Archaeoglobus veneficus]|uniref:Lysylphosphatidylglycerol synthetase/UPF0104 n=1 Tax=Archaeoglobus veneficus (strain DSM 11195 / SNP6) TaxID=693661 RepID=F2KRG7_ARCVS|nr:flippase-like domain-containing protein [Archaeoglobus veneficus]AEA46732.1 Lysylphosphatidylglycerol synthetase/UPF0104 [Archaeoglobus veneficus SNP6]